MSRTITIIIHDSDDDPPDEDQKNKTQHQTKKDPLVAQAELTAAIRQECGYY